MQARIAGGIDHTRPAVARRREPDEPSRGRPRAWRRWGATRAPASSRFALAATRSDAVAAAAGPVLPRVVVGAVGEGGAVVVSIVATVVGSCVVSPTASRSARSGRPASRRSPPTPRSRRRRERQGGPDPIARIPADPPSPALRQRRHEPRRPQSQPALQAVLLVRLGRGAAAGTRASVLQHQASADCFAGSACVSSEACSGSSTGLPQLPQNLTPAGSGVPHLAHATTGREPTGRPQLPQKWAPQASGAPHSHRGPPRRAEDSRESSSSRRFSSATRSAQRSVTSSTRNRSRLNISKTRPPRSRIRSSRSRRSARCSRLSAAGLEARRGASPPAVRALRPRPKGQDLASAAESSERVLQRENYDALLGELAHRVRGALAGVAGVLDPAVGHLVGSKRRRLVDGHAAELELLAARRAVRTFP